MRSLRSDTLTMRVTGVRITVFCSAIVNRCHCSLSYRRGPLSQMAENKCPYHRVVGFLILSGQLTSHRFHEEEKEKEKERLAVHDEAAAVMERARLLLEQAGKRRKRKKRRLPRTSSHSSRSRARLRQRQWHAPGWLQTVHAVFPSFFDRPKMLGFLVGMDQKDRYAAWLRPRSSPTSTVALAWLVLLVSCCVSLRCPQAQDAWHLVSVWTRRDSSTARFWPLA